MWWLPPCSYRCALNPPADMQQCKSHPWKPLMWQQEWFSVVKLFPQSNACWRMEITISFKLKAIHKQMCCNKIRREICSLWLVFCWRHVMLFAQATLLLTHKFVRKDNPWENKPQYFRQHYMFARACGVMCYWWIKKQACKLAFLVFHWLLGEIKSVTGPGRNWDFRKAGSKTSWPFLFPILIPWQLPSVTLMFMCQPILNSA